MPPLNPDCTYTSWLLGDLELWLFPKKREPQYRPQNTIVLILGTPKRVPLNWGNPAVNLRSAGEMLALRVHLLDNGIWGFGIEDLRKGFKYTIIRYLGFG